MPTFSGSLNVNAIQSALYNMIISQDIIGGSLVNNYNLVDKARVNGGLIGDTKLYTDVPNLTSAPWVQDSNDALNLLAIKRPGAPKTQAIVLNVFRQAMVTKDAILTKQAFMTEGGFINYQSVLDGRLSKSKEVYDTTTYNAFIGSCVPEVTLEIDLRSASSGQPLYGVTGTEKTELEGELIGNAIDDLISDIKDYNTKYTKNGFMRAFGENSLTFIANQKFVNKLKNISQRNIRHNDNLFNFDDTLTDRYNSIKITSTNISTYAANTPTTGKPFDADGDNAYTPGSNNANGKVISLVEKDVTVGGTAYHVYAGEEIPAGSTVGSSKTFEYGEIGIHEDNVIGRIFGKLPPYMSAFAVATSFYNDKNLSTNSYLTWGHNTLEALDSEVNVKIVAKY